ncbi:hypothetical protein AH04_273 [Erwinia phage AH04]|uniref:Uncharacterized protein n=1 Tax=Erwinia phage AH04 TaxID=2869569 RepID=A0AAE7X219_9CAUD|nr:hypothetical protein PQC02_gp041 [Erwinia phage AH04]QZA70746.1 hypothetical protein AH04_273 [Erwinia phage AH04]
MVDCDLPDCQFDPIDQRDGSDKHYIRAVSSRRSGKYLVRNLEHIAIALDILQVAKCVESIGDSEGVDSKLLQGRNINVIFGIKGNGTWAGYRQYVLDKYNIDMGPVPENAQRPYSVTIEVTIHNWLNGEPLLFY